jgi:hypothetical protein
MKQTEIKENGEGRGKRTMNMKIVVLYSFKVVKMYRQCTNEFSIC